MESHSTTRYNTQRCKTVHRKTQLSKGAVRSNGTGGTLLTHAVSLFSGCGGSDVGLRLAGIEPIWANDASESACALYEKVVGSGIIVHSHIQKIDCFPKAPLLVGCYPCQGYSQGGRRNPSDQRNYLFLEFARALRAVRPLAFIVENVSGMRQSHNQYLFTQQLKAFEECGYVVNHQILNAADYGLPQNRRRIFLVGIKKSLKKSFVFPEPTHGNPDSPHVSLRQKIWDLRDAPVGSYNDEPFHWYYLSRNRRPDWDGLSPTIVAHWRHAALHPDSPPLIKVAKDKWEFAHSGKARRLNYLECSSIQGFPNPYAFSIRSVCLRMRAIGNAVPPPLFAAVARQLAATLSKAT